MIPCQRPNFFFIRAGTVNNSITTSISGISKIKEELMPKNVLPTGTSNGAKATEIPETNTRLNTLAPITLPIPREARPFFKEVMVVTSSGKEVPSATKVRAITVSGTPSFVAMMVPWFTKSLAPTAITAAPTTNKSNCCQSGFSLFSYASFSSLSVGFFKPLRTFNKV